MAACRAAGELDFYRDANAARDDRFHKGDDSDELPERRDDLATDARIEFTHDVSYALRPESVRDVLAGRPPSPEVLAIAEQHPFEPGPEPWPEYFRYVNEGMFEMTARQYLAALESAAEDGLGVITIISQ